MISVFKSTSSFNALWDKKERAKGGVEYGTYNVSVQVVPHAVGRKDSENRVSVFDVRSCAAFEGESGGLRDRPLHSLMILMKGERVKRRGCVATLI